MNIKTIELFGSTLFNWVTIDKIVNMPAPMPEDEAAFVFVLKGQCINYSETDELRLGANQAVLAKCGNNTFRTLPVDGDPEYSAISIRFHRKTLERLYADAKSPFFKKIGQPLSLNSVSVHVSKLLETSRI